jgi:hypothetical protein
MRMVFIKTCGMPSSQKIEVEGKSRVGLRIN